MKQRKNKKPIINAYGFDKLGFAESTDLDTEAFQLRFISYRSPKSLDEADGIIVPSGIFEDFKTVSREWQPRTVCTWDAHALAEREKQMMNAWKSGAWICFLLGHIDNGDNDRWSDTDLAKKFANGFFYGVQGHDPQPHVECKADEFREFFTKYGIARSSMTSPRDKGRTRILASCHTGTTIYSAEIDGSIFFLPFVLLTRLADVSSLIKYAIEGILTYKKRNDLYLPDWVEDLQFEKEKVLSSEIEMLEQRLTDLREESVDWRNFKGILTASGRTLNEVVVKVLRSFFGLNLCSEEKYIDDARIYSEDNEVAFVVEIKGVNGGIKREHVNQVDSHRERLDLSPKIPGLRINVRFRGIRSSETTAISCGMTSLPWRLGGAVDVSLVPQNVE